MLYEYNTFCLSIQQLMDIWIAFGFWPIMLLYTFLCEFPFMTSFQELHIISAYAETFLSLHVSGSDIDPTSPWQKHVRWEILL